MNYSIYQQALDLQASGLNEWSTNTIAFGLAKYIQIVLPQLAYYLVYPLINQRRIEWLLSLLNRSEEPDQRRKKALELSQSYHRLQGFFTWKLACDLGFFLVVTQYGPWTRALTLPGLITYTIGQLIIYYLIGQRWILASLQPRSLPNRPKELRIRRLQLAFSRLFHEELGVTVNQVPMRVAVAKLLVDYVAMYLTWSLYTIGFFLISQAEYDLTPLVIFPHVSMISFYLCVYLGYAFSFTLLDTILRQIYMMVPRRLDAFSWVLRSSELTKALGSIGSMLLLPLGVSLLLPLWFALGQASIHFSQPIRVWTDSTSAPVVTWGKSPPSSAQSCGVECLNSLVSDYLTRPINQSRMGE